jgi:hypothetical protein
MGSFFRQRHCSRSSVINVASDARFDLRNPNYDLLEVGEKVVFEEFVK